MSITKGSVVSAVTASGEVVELRALGAPQRGMDFVVVWVCTEDEWARVANAGSDVEVDGIPWPLDALVGSVPRA